MKRVGYDADNGRYYFRDREGLLYKGPEGSEFGELTLGKFWTLLCYSRISCRHSVSGSPTSVPQEMDEDSDLEAAPTRTDGYSMLAVNEVALPHFS